MDIRLQKELNILHALNFQKAGDMGDQLRNLILDANLSPAEIGLCSSRLFISEQSLFTFLELHVGTKDTHLSETRKVLLNFIGAYLKKYRNVNEYVDWICEKCFYQFKREQSNKAKEAALYPIIIILKHHKSNVRARDLCCALLDELKFCKPAATVKGSIFNTLGLLIGKYHESLSGIERNCELECFQVAIAQLLEQTQSRKPEQSAITGMIKFFKNSLIYNQLNDQQLADLFTCLKVFLIEIDDVSNYKVLNSAVKCLTVNVQKLEALLFKYAEDIFEKVLKLLVHKNKAVKESASELFEKFIHAIAFRLDQEGQHRKIFNLILDKFCEIIGNKKQDLFLLTVVIRSIGLFGKAIVKLRGEKQLKQLFDHLIELSNDRLLLQEEKNENTDIKKGASFKAVLYKQKQMNSFVISYANLIKCLTQVSDKEIQHVYQICLAGAKGHYNLFDNYKQYLYNGLVNVMISLVPHCPTFLDRFVMQALEESLKVYDQESYVNTCAEVAKMMKGLIMHQEWTQHSMKRFTDAIFRAIQQSIQNVNLDAKIIQFQDYGPIEYRLQATNPQSLVLFHRVTMVYSTILPLVTIESLQQSLLHLVKIYYKSLKEHPKAILLLQMGRIIIQSISQALDATEFTQLLQTQLRTYMLKIIHLIISQLRNYNLQLQQQALTLLMFIPVDQLIADQYSLLRSRYLIILKQAFELGNSCLPLSFASLDLLIALISQQKNVKTILKLLKDIIPKLSEYMQDKQTSPEIYTPIEYIDQIPLSYLLSESNQTYHLLALKVKTFLGSIGGLCHTIVGSTNENLLAWDYQSPINFEINFGQKKMQLRVSVIVARLLILTEQSNDKLKVQSGELLHSFLTYLIGKSADEMIHQAGAQQTYQRDLQERAFKLKKQFAQLYKQVLPVMIRLSVGSHPCKQLYSTTLMQFARWLANSKQYDAPDVCQFLESVFDGPLQTDDPQLEQHCSQLIGEFIKWTIKQTTPEQLSQNYFNIKTVVRRISTFLTHPDQKYKSMGFECLVQFILHSHNEAFIIQKYYVELIQLIKFANLQETSMSKAAQIVDNISIAFKTTNALQGHIGSMSELQEYLFKEATSGRDSYWQDLALQIFIYCGNAKEYLQKETIPIARLILDPLTQQNLKETSRKVETLSYQCRTWLFLKQHVNVTKFQGFSTTEANIEEFFRFLESRESVVEDSSLADILLTLTQDQVQSQRGAESVDEQLIAQSVTTIYRALLFCQEFQIPSDIYKRVSLCLAIRPSYMLKGIQLDVVSFDRVFNQIKLLVQATDMEIYTIFQLVYENRRISEICKSGDVAEIRQLLQALLIPKDRSRVIKEIHFVIETLDTERAQMLLDYLFQVHDDDFVLKHLSQQSIFQQQYLHLLLQYITKRLPEIGQIYLTRAKEYPDLLKHLVAILSSCDLTHFFEWSLTCSDTILHMQILFIVITKLNASHPSVLEVLRYALTPTHQIEIHREALLLFGLHARYSEPDQKYLNDIRNKYFPIKLKELIPDSLQSINFKTIFKFLIDMINLSGKLSMIEVLFPLIRQDIDLTEFIEAFIRNNDIQYAQIQWLFTQCRDEDLDRNPVENLRIALANKILIPILQNSKYILSFFVEYTPFLLQQMAVKQPDTWEQLLFWVRWQTVILDLFSLLYREIPDKVKTDLHPQLYKNSQGNELTKKLIADCYKIKKTKFEKSYLLDIVPKEFQDKHMLAQYYSAAFSVLVYVMIATQTKENLFVQFLFQPKIGEQLWDAMISEWNYGFTSETQFREIAIHKLIENDEGTFQDRIAHRYVTTLTMGEQEVVPEYQTGQVPETMVVEKQIDQTIEMDEINKHKAMIPLLQLIEFMNTKFEQGQDTPGWMTQLYNELSKDQPLAVRVFLIKVIINKINVFAKYPIIWLDALLSYAQKENKPNGGKGFHYFLRDVIVIIIKLSQAQNTRDEYLKLYPQSKQRLCSVINNLILLTAHTTKKLFDQNIEILASLMTLYKDHIYVSDKSVVQMIGADKQADAAIWQQNGLAVLEVAMLSGVRILNDYGEFIKSQNGQISEKYRFVLSKSGICFPSQQIYLLAINYATPKSVMKGIAQAYGAVLVLLDSLKIDKEEYIQEIIKVISGILLDTRPGYARQKFTEFMKITTRVFPRVLNNGRLFTTCLELIRTATAKERACILDICLNYLLKIEQYSANAQEQVSQIVIAIQVDIDKILSDQDPTVHQYLLTLLKQLASLKCINLCTDIILNCYKNILKQLHQTYSTHNNLQFTSDYQHILMLLHEYLSNMIDYEFSEVTDNLLSTFASQHIKIRKDTFEYFQRVIEKRGVMQQYQLQKEFSMTDRIITLIKNMYQPNQETLWLRGAVPLILAQSKRSSDYDKMIFDRPLDEQAANYDIDFRGAKHFKQNNLTQQQFGTQFGSQSSSLLSQAIQPKIQVRETQPAVVEMSYQNIQSQFSQIDNDGFYIPTNRSKFGKFISNNKLDFSAVSLNSDNLIRYTQDSQLGSISTRDRARVKFEQKNTFQTNKIRSYRIGELPDIMIKQKDIIDPLLELCFEDEELAGRMFVLIFRELHEVDNLQDLLFSLLERSTQKNFEFISTILKTLYQLMQTGKPCKGSTIKKIGMESMAIQQALILVEEQVIQQEDGWMDLIDLHQFMGNQAEVLGILRLLKPDSDIGQQIENVLSSKQQYNFQASKKILNNLIDQGETVLKDDADEFDLRMMAFLKTEYEDVLQKLGQWHDLDNALVKRCSEADSLQSDEAKRALHKLLLMPADRQVDVAKCNSIISKVSQKETLSFEYAQLLQCQLDVDQSRFWREKASKAFLQQWAMVNAQNQILSHQLKHHALQSLQLLHELEEWQTIYQGNDYDVGERRQIFQRWSTRSPSLEHDKLVTWHRIFESRKLMVSHFTIEETVAEEIKWCILQAKGLYKMHLLDQANDLLAESYQLTKKFEVPFTYSFYATTAKVKLKQLQLRVESYDRTLFIQNLKRGEYHDELETHEQYVKLFKKYINDERQNIADPNNLLKFQLLPLRCLENYTIINQDIIFMAQKLPVVFYQRYGAILNETLIGYQQANREEQFSKFYRIAADFCERTIRLIDVENGGSPDLRRIIESKGQSMEILADQFLRFAIQAFKLGKNQNLLIKILKVVQKFPDLIGPTFQEACEQNHLASSHFLPYLPQMIHLLNSEKQMQYFQKIFKDLVVEHTEQFSYQFNVCFPNLEDCNNKYSQAIYKELRKRAQRNFEFIYALNQLTHPQHRVLYYLGLMKEDPDNQKIYKEQMLIDVFAKPYQGAYLINFTKQYEQKLQSPNAAEIEKLTKQLKEDAQKARSGSHNLMDMSEWFSRYSEDSLTSQLSVPIPPKFGDIYFSRPKIASFDQKMLILGSLRRPKRIKIYGTDEKAYVYLVKGCEDLRLDQRIEQLFDVMNDLQSECSMGTYGVIPMSKTVGLLEWVEQTEVLKEILQTEFQNQNPGRNLVQDNQAYTNRINCVREMYKKMRISNHKMEDISNQQAHQVLLHMDPRSVAEYFLEQKSYIPSNLLRNSLLNMSVSLEAFVFIRNKFLQNYAVVCAAGYIMGIGDRHLENFLLNYSTGQVVSIDFGYSFGTAMNLPIPELMPFRLTNVFEGLAKPVGINGLFRQSMINVMQQLREQRHILLDFCEVFINDPLLDQLKKNKNPTQDFTSQSNRDDQSLSASQQEHLWYPKKKLDILRQKLTGVHCSMILQQELEEASKHNTQKYTRNLKETIVGTQGRYRASLTMDKILTVSEQVDCLIDLATDPSIIGRCWVGWTPFV